jgi:hypothetical protein
MALAKRLNRRVQPLGQSAKYSRPLGVAAFRFLLVVDFPTLIGSSELTLSHLRLRALSWVSQRASAIAAVQQ